MPAYASLFQGGTPPNAQDSGGERPAFRRSILAQSVISDRNHIHDNPIRDLGNINRIGDLADRLLHLFAKNEPPF